MVQSPETDAKDDRLVDIGDGPGRRLRDADCGLSNQDGGRTQGRAGCGTGETPGDDGGTFAAIALIAAAIALACLAAVVAIFVAIVLA